MHFLDILVFVVYILIVLLVGFYFHKKNTNTRDYYTGGSSMGAGHIGLSVVATDVGGGFSIGLGGLGFVMGLSGSWMLFTGLIGAWISAVVLIPYVVKARKEWGILTFPEFIKGHYSKQVAVVAGVISFIGYLGFTASQLLAGAKLAVGTFPELSQDLALLVMGTVAVVYTVFGGIKAVIYTDTFQWIVLMGGLILIGVPLAYNAVGGWEVINQSLAPEMLSFGNVSYKQLINWSITIIPIWFVGMTLYQRMIACKDVKTAKKAWFVAGLFEYPLMAFMGTFLGLLARVAFTNGMFESLGYPAGAGLDAELGLPMLLRVILPFGMLGLMMSVYFSAILSTADSCLLAASGNFLTDILRIDPEHKKGIRWSQWITLSVGVVAILIALRMESVLNLMLYSYAFMVSGLLIPVLAILVWKKPKPIAALSAMVLGGGSTLIISATSFTEQTGFDPILPGLMLSTAAFVLVQRFSKPIY